jgi:phosphoribosylaminoimidazolecarboxamide formyltransferase / IMP cyclohydrolase
MSVWDKTGLEEFARGLAELDVELVASGGTAEFLGECGVEATPVEELTEIPEMLGGRVKTLHPRIHAAILARRDHPDDLAALDEHDISPFDLVCVGLYPFAQIAARHGVTEEDAVEMIDIGGPSMLRGAAKNFAHVAPVCRPERYPQVLSELRRDGALSSETRRELAAEAFATTAAYEAAIATWFLGRESFPELFIPRFTKVMDLAYGENPHQRAAYYAEEGARRHLLSRVEQIHGRQLSFNNLNDLSAARRLLGEFQLPACVIVKHANPCGVGVAASIEEAFAKAHAADPVSAYGMVLALNRPVSAELGQQLAGKFVEVAIAPEFDDAGLDAMRQKPATRVLVDRERRRSDLGEREYKRVLGGLRRSERGNLGRSPLRVARLQARGLQRDRDRQGPADDRHRRRPDEPRRLGPDRDRESTGPRPRPCGLGARLGCADPVRRRAGAGTGSGRDSDHPARRREARRGGRRRRP